MRVHNSMEMDEKQTKGLPTDQAHHLIQDQIKVCSITMEGAQESPNKVRSIMGKDLKLEGGIRKQEGESATMEMAIDVTDICLLHGRSFNPGGWWVRRRPCPTVYRHTAALRVNW